MRTNGSLIKSTSLLLRGKSLRGHASGEGFKDARPAVIVSLLKEKSDKNSNLFIYLTKLAAQDVADFCKSSDRLSVIKWSTIIK